MTQHDDHSTIETELSAHASADDEADKTVIQVDDVPKAIEPLPEIPIYEAIEALINHPIYEPTYMDGTNEEFVAQLLEAYQTRLATQQRNKIEACSGYRGQLVADVIYHPLIAAVHLAYCDHRPLCLSPDHIWLAICQGFAHHVNLHAETLRSQFVQHQGKLKIQIRRDDFVKGSADNPWNEMLGKFSTAIRDHIGSSTHDLLCSRFSTTTPIEQTAFEIVLLDAMQSYFEYEAISLCGIPEIKIEGTVADWESILTRVQKFPQFGLEWWTHSLIPILEKIVETVKGESDQSFWKVIYKLNEKVSGGPYAQGWITAFFPYLNDYTTGKATRPNDMLRQIYQSKHDFLLHADHYEGLTNRQYPSGLSSAPFTWIYMIIKYKMEFLGGFIGVEQDSRDLTLRPKIGWAVREAIDSSLY